MLSRINTCLFSLALPAFLLFGCSNKDVTGPTAFQQTDLSNASYNVVGLNSAENVVILGQLDFAELNGFEISGTWKLETWGEQPQFPHLPAEGMFSGLIHGETAIVNIDLPQTEDFLGLIVQGFEQNKLVGTLRLLPGSEFSGRFEAIKK